MAVYRLEVMRRGIIVVDDVDSLEDAEEYIENCNLVDEVNWSDFLETVQGGTELQKISVPDSMAIKEFADKMEVLPSEIIRWLFLRGKVENLGSEICFDDMTEAFPAFVTIIMMPLTYSIADGIVLGLLTYVLFKLFAGKYRELNLTMYILSILCILKYVFV